MKKGLAAILLLLSFHCDGQQKSVITQYMYNRLLLNPAYAGNQNQLTVNVLFRKQWVNFDGAPTTETFTAHSSIKKKRVGVGLAVINDKIGVHSDIGVYGMYAYKIPMSRGVLAMGLQAGFNKLTSDFTQLNINQANDLVFTTFENKFNPNFGAGLFYSTATSYLGISSPYLLENGIIRSEGNASQAKESRYIFLTGGKVMDLNKEVKFMPSFLIRYQTSAPVGVDVNANFFLKNVINVGLSYRSADAVSAMFAIILNDNLTFGYAYDYTLSDINNYASGTHEFMLTYHISLYREKCHTYF